MIVCERFFFSLIFRKYVLVQFIFTLWLQINGNCHQNFSQDSFIPIFDANNIFFLVYIRERHIKDEDELIRWFEMDGGAFIAWCWSSLAHLPGCRCGGGTCRPLSTPGYPIGSYGGQYWESCWCCWYIIGCDCAWGGGGKFGGGCCCCWGWGGGGGNEGWYGESGGWEWWCSLPYGRGEPRPPVKHTPPTQIFILMLLNASFSTVFIFL